MAACREELTVNPGESHIAVAELDGFCAGIAEISVDGEHAELKKLFVDPALQGRGIGKVLFEWAKTEALRKGARVLALDADPGALAFYERMGGQIVGRSPSGSIPGRILPRLELRLCGTVEA
ncbi:GNAT family N-acetyltransferase [Chelativorans sp.]|uniref:GNAT family N-acetyltransferase n=1 Tax=Chelativorans sp. TaxID=2203393 RepID=UPI0028121C1A|nr:GNAT family N-acetyltransferase [Chelativorans sp.]